MQINEKKMRQTNKKGFFRTLGNKICMIGKKNIYLHLKTNNK